MIIEPVVDPFVALVILVVLTVEVNSELRHRVVEPCQRPDELDQYAAERYQTADDDYQRGENFSCHEITSQKLSVPVTPGS